MRSRWLLGLAAVLAFAAGAWVAYAPVSGPTAAGRPASELLGVSLPDVYGKDQPIAQWQGKVLVVNFWATWCAPCREEMPMFMRLQREGVANGVQFVGIAVDNVDKVRQFSNEIGLNYPTLIGGFGAMELSKALGNSLVALPFTVILDRTGRVAHTQLGPLKEDQLTGILQKLR